jgi:hypothetical protein
MISYLRITAEGILREGTRMASDQVKRKLAGILAGRSPWPVLSIC